MKYMIGRFERQQGGSAEYEQAQERIPDVFTQWKRPPNFKIELFVVRVGERDGRMLVECDDRWLSTRHARPLQRSYSRRGR